MSKNLANKLAALALPAFALVLGSAQAANIDSNEADFSFVSDTSEDTDLTTNPTSITSPVVMQMHPELEQFDHYYGVLTGVTLYMESDQKLYLDGQASGVTSKPVYFAGRGNIGTNRAIFNPLGGSLAQWGGTINVGKYNDVTTSGVKCTTDCSISREASTADSESSTQSITDKDALNEYIGTGIVSTDALGFEWNPAAVRANVYSQDPAVTASAAATLTWEGKVTATYTYLDHAYASFNDGLNYNDELTLDFGSIQQGGSASPQGFSIYNLENESTGLDFTGISSSSGDTSILTTDLAAFENLLAGDFLNFLAFFDTSKVGSFAATYTLSFRDTIGIGASASQHSDQTLTLNLLGNVVAPVPVPPAVWLFGSALAGVGIIGRRRETA